MASWRKERMVRSCTMNYAGTTPLDLLLFMVGSMWAVLSGIVPSPISYDLLSVSSRFPRTVPGVLSGSAHATREVHCG